MRLNLNDLCVEKTVKTRLFSTFLINAHIVAAYCNVKITVLHRLQAVIKHLSVLQLSSYINSYYPNAYAQEIGQVC